MTTPPGWYPEPGQTEGPGLERWWNGTEWTEYTRTPTAPAAAPGYPPQPGAPAGYPGAYPAYPGFPGEQPPAKRRRGVIAAAVVAGVVVVGAITAGAVALSGGHDHSDSDAKSGSAQHQPGRTGQGPGGGDSGGLPGGSGGSSGGDSGGSSGGSSGGASPQPRESEPQADPGYALDPYSGLEMPVPKGWTGGTTDSGAGSYDGAYQCPDDKSQNCAYGGADLELAEGRGVSATTAKKAAQQDIKKNASDNYGGKTYGGLTSHQQTDSRAVTVAGQQGYLITWKVSTKQGTSGYVESVAFPAPADKKQLVILRLERDVNPKAPTASDLAGVLKGIKQSASGGTGV
jgi:hypothetical protein